MQLYRSIHASTSWLESHLIALLFLKAVLQLSGDQRRRKRCRRRWWNIAYIQQDSGKGHRHQHCHQLTPGCA